MDDRDDEAESRARVGTVVGGRWRLDELLGVGGMGAVFRATHVEIDSVVALKILLGRYATNTEVRERFQSEGRFANKVRHAGAVKITDSSVTEDGSPYLVMEYLRGTSLQARWEAAGYRLAPRDVLDIAARLLEVLANAHEAGVIHRDIKPDNIFLTTANELKVLDFGIARLQEAAHRAERPAAPGKTRMGAPMGTMGFMSPEQALGRWNEVDARTDLWAVGALIYALLAGITVDEAAGSWLLEPPPVRGRVPDLDARVAAIVDRALRPRREDRFPDASTMRAEILAARAGLPETPPLALPGDTRMDAPAMRPASPSGVTATGATISGATGTAPATSTAHGAAIAASGPPSASIVTGGRVTELGAPALDAMSPAPPHAAGPPYAAVPPVAPREPRRSNNLGLVAVAVVLGFAALGVGAFFIARSRSGGGHDAETGGDGRPPRAPSAAPTSPVTAAVAPPPKPPPLPVVTAGPHADGKACEETSGKKYCGGHCVSLGEPSTGCRAGTCKPCDLANAVASCPKPGQQQACLVASCHPGFGDCDKSEANGCETALTTVANCGRCGNACTAGANAAAACTDGKCAVTCSDGFADCDKSPANGCEVNLKTTVANCGACGHACPSGPGGEASCRAGVCALACAPGHFDCNGNPADGCEVDLASDAKNCGSCGNACRPPQGGTVSCEAARCKAACPAGATYHVESNSCAAAAPPPPPSPAPPSAAPLAPPTEGSARKPRGGPG